MYVDFFLFLTLSYPSRSRKLLTSNRLPSTESRDTWDSVRIETGIEESSRQFSSRRKTFSLGAQDTAGDKLKIWSRTQHKVHPADVHHVIYVIPVHSINTEERKLTWFWLRLISMACSSATSAGTAWILFLDRSRTSRWRREPSPPGNSLKWFPDRLRVRRAFSWPMPAGSCFNWFPLRMRVSSFLSFPISFGRLAVRVRTNVVKIYSMFSEFEAEM